MATDKDSILPPSLAFTSFRSAIQGLRDHGLPGSLDRSAWRTRSGTEQTQIVAALKFLGLTDGNGTTQQMLKALVAVAENTAEEKSIWANLLRTNYTSVFLVDLANATPKQLEDAMGEHGLAGLARERAIRFFLKAATHAKIPLSTRLTANLRERSSPAGEDPENGGNGDTTPKPPGKPKRKRRTPASTGTGTPAGPQGGTAPESNAMKSIQLPKVGGSLSIAGTFNAFQLMGEERELVYKIIDLMTAYEEKSNP